MNASRRYAALLGIGVLIGLSRPSARAGDYHRDASLPCSDCHVMHYSEQHGYGGETVAPPASGGPFPHLLRDAVIGLCLSCHDGQTGSGGIAPDVVQSAGVGQAAHRSAGAFQEPPGAQTQNGHGLDVSATPPGGSGTMTLGCVSCHDPHGNAYYRNLVANPGGQSGLGVTAASETAVSPTATHYDISNIHYTASDGGLSAWCGGCHGSFHGAGGTTNVGGAPLGDTNQAGVTPWLRHPTRDVTMAGANLNQHVDKSRWFSPLSSRVPMVSPSRTIPGTGAGSDNEVFCGTCHKAHGSTHRYGLIWDDASTAEPEDGVLEMQTCQQCHYK